MSEERTARRDLHERVEELARERFPEGVVRVLERKFPGHDGTLYEDAVAEAVKKLLEAGERREITNPEGYLTRIATNELRRALKRAARETLPRADDDDGEADSEWFDRHTRSDEKPTETTAVGEMVYAYVKSVVEGWESLRLRTTTLLVLEGAYIGDSLTGEELAERVGDILGEDVMPATARQWRKRGLDRLQDQLGEDDILTND